MTYGISTLFLLKVLSENGVSLRNSQIHSRSIVNAQVMKCGGNALEASRDYKESAQPNDYRLY